MLAAALLVCGLIVLFLFTAKAVVLQTTPKAELSVSGGMSFKLADHYLLLQGEYTLEATADGYYPLTETVNVAEAQNQTYQFELAKLPGHLTVLTPNIDAEIWIDGVLAGRGNQTINNVKAGEHAIKVVADRYQPHQQVLEIIGLDQTQDLTLTLKPAWANVSFSSEPSNAELYANGDLLGRTPLDVELLEGEHQLMIKLSGYKAWQESLDVEAEQNINMPQVSLDKADGLVLVKTQPSGAGLTVNGTYRGQSPFELNLAPGQRYQITVFKEGYQAANQNIDVVSGKEQMITLKLQPQLGDVKIVSQPNDALLYIDGRLMGRANQTLSLPSKQHRVSIQKEGYVTYNSAVLPRPGIAQSVRIKLLTLEQHKWKNIKPLINTVAGSQLKLFKVDAKFSMGASRREQGRRSNEAIRPVHLTRAFYLGTSAVTNAESREFVKQHSSGHVKGNSLNGEKYPVVNITWTAAAAYCNWLSEQENLPIFYRVENGEVTGINPQSNGYRMPTEAEWAWAARVKTDGSLLKFPWGSAFPITKKSGNYGDRRAAALLGNIQATYDDGYAVTAPKASFSANHNGLFDMGGNVAEWVSDYYGIKTGLSRRVDVDPTGPQQGSHHVIRGSSWAHGTVTDLRLAFRDYGSDKRTDLGFRVARYVD